MVLTESSDYIENRKMSHFELFNTNGESINTETLIGKNGLLIIFTCNHCPYAKALWKRLIKDYNEFLQNKFNILAINPNINPNYPEDSPEKMKDLIKELKLPFEYVIDVNQEIAKLYDAVCTPDFFLMNDNMELIYRGSYDDNWKDDQLVTKKYILDIIKSSENGRKNNDMQPSIGCSIKWLENK